MFPRWISWLLLAVMGYLLVTGNVTRAPQKPLPAVTEPAVALSDDSKPANAYPQISAATDIERWKKAINPTYAEHTQCDFTPSHADTLPLHSITERDGMGDGAKCGTLIHAKLVVWNERGTATYTGETDLTLGEREIAAGLDAALLGIKPNETRTVILPPEALTHAKKTPTPKPLLAALKAGKVTVITLTRLQ